MAYASYVTELVDALTAEEDPTDTLFPLLASTLAWGERKVVSQWRCVRLRFALMRELGYEPELYSCLNCRGRTAGKGFSLPRARRNTLSQLCRPVPGKQHVKPGNMGNL